MIEAERWGRVVLGVRVQREAEVRKKSVTRAASGLGRLLGHSSEEVGTPGGRNQQRRARKKGGKARRFEAKGEQGKVRTRT